MGVALAVADAALPRSMGLFLGNSMPIRDVDALAGIAKTTSDEVVDVRGSVPFGPGVSHRGESRRERHRRRLERRRGVRRRLGTTGDASRGGRLVPARRDNGLLLLRERPGQPPVTVVVVNNGGGGIFSFLPVADQIDAPKFTKLFATPPDVSRRGLCDAHRVARAPSTPSARCAPRCARRGPRGGTPWWR